MRHVVSAACLILIRTKLVLVKFQCRGGQEFIFESFSSSGIRMQRNKTTKKSTS